MRISDWSSDVCSSDLLAEARQVPVQGRVTAAVVEDHRAAVAALPADEGHARIAGSHHRRAGGRGEIHALVGAGAAQDRVLARAGEARTDPRVLHRHADEGLLQRRAVGAEVFGLAAALEAVGAVNVTGTGACGGRAWTCLEPSDRE